MKKLQTPLFLLCLFIQFSAVSCKKEQPDPPPDLPPLTNVGAMTFGCYVNGKPWVAQVPPFQAEFRHLSASYSLSKKRFILSALKMNKESNTEQIGMIVENLSSIDTSYTNNLKKYPYRSFNFICQDSSRNIDFEIDSTRRNEITFTHFDINKRIVSGQFNFSVYAIKCPEEKVELTDGRFDLFISIIE